MLLRVAATGKASRPDSVLDSEGLDGDSSQEVLNTGSLLGDFHGGGEKYLGVIGRCVCLLPRVTLDAMI